MATSTLPTFERFVVILQFRTDVSGPHELACMQRLAAIPFGQIIALNCAHPAVTQSDLAPFFAKATHLIIGGWGEAGYESQGPVRQWVDDTIAKVKPLITSAIDRGVFVLGSCFGHQLLADLYGGQVTADPAYGECGVLPQYLTPAASTDPLIGHFPDEFLAVVGHQGSVISVPDSATVLSASDRCPITACRYAPRVWGFQFHPELNLAELLYRLRLYDTYDTQSLSDEHDVSPCVETFLAKFTQLSSSEK